MRIIVLLDVVVGLPGLQEPPERPPSRKKDSGSREHAMVAGHRGLHVEGARRVSSRLCTAP